MSFHSAFASRCSLCDLRHITTVFLHPFVLSLIRSLNSPLLSTLHLQDAVLGAVDEVTMQEMLSSPQQTWKTNEGGKAICMCVCAQSLSHICLFVTPRTVALQAPPSMEFARQEHWSGLPFPTPGDLPALGIEPRYLASPALAGGFFTTAPPGKPFAYAWLLSHVQFLCSRDFPGKNTGVGCHFLLQGIFLT